jgi:hypothetical protein
MDDVGCSSKARMVRKSLFELSKRLRLREVGIVGSHEIDLTFR